jgi:pyridoxamine 5'-phosphate oxidase family protein
MSFSTVEVEYLECQPLARFASVDAAGQPDVVPVTFDFDGPTFWIGAAGEALRHTKRYNNVVNGQILVALVIDDVVSFEPFIARGIRVYGHASPPVERIGSVGQGIYIQITPTVSWSWNMEAAPAGRTWYTPRRAIHRTK